MNVVYLQEAVLLSAVSTFVKELYQILRYHSFFKVVEVVEVVVSMEHHTVVGEENLKSHQVLFLLGIYHLMLQKIHWLNSLKVARKSE